MSIDGYLDSGARERLILSNETDLDRIDAERADSDAILVGAATVRKDDPRLLVRSAARRADRTARGATPSPIKVTVTEGGDLDPRAAFFSTGDGEKLVYCPRATVEPLRGRLGAAATIVDIGNVVDLRSVSEDLSSRGVNRLLVEGGGSIHTQLLAADLADELQLVVAPFFVGDSRARRFVGDGAFPWHAKRRAPLAGVRQIGDVALLRYALSSRFEAR
jgi:5-amino-6-(5-phosphoribosylamino)uracil reductase